MIDETLSKNLDIIKHLINNKDYDWLHVVTGVEGTGKSTLATELCVYVDPNFFEKDNVITNITELKTCFRNSEKGTAILIDEGAPMFFSRDSMKKETKEATQLLRGLRGKNCFICICMPDFFALDKYIREHRVGSLSRVVKRGRAWFYSKSKIEKMLTSSHSVFNKNFGKSKWTDPNFKHNFPDLDKVTKTKYLKMKDNIMNKYTAKDKPKGVNKKIVIERMLNEGYEINKIAKALDTAPRYVKDVRFNMKLLETS